MPVGATHLSQRDADANADSCLLDGAPDRAARRVLVRAECAVWKDPAVRVGTVHQQHLRARIPFAHNNGTGGCRLLRRFPMMGHMDRLPKRREPFNHVQGVVAERAGCQRGNGVRLVICMFAA